MADFKEIFKKHKVAVIGGAIGIVLLYVLYSRNSSASNGTTSSDQSALEIAQLEASSNLQQAQIQGQQNEAQISANAETTNTEASLQAQQDQYAAALTSQIYTQGTDTQLYEQELADANTESQAYDNLAATLAPTALQISQQGGRVNSQTGATELATILGESNSGTVGSLNSSLGAESVATSINNEKLLSGLEGIGGSALAGVGL